MIDLIKALTILLKYKDVKYPFVCEHDMLHVVGYDGLDFAADDVAQLQELGFHNERYPTPGDDEIPEDEREDAWYSFRYGSA